MSSDFGENRSNLYLAARAIYPEGFRARKTKNSYPGATIFLGNHFLGYFAIFQKSWTLSYDHMGKFPSGSKKGNRGDLKKKNTFRARNPSR